MLVLYCKLAVIMDRNVNRNSGQNYMQNKNALYDLGERIGM